MTRAAAASASANAAIWYAPDGYDPAARGINGRRVAGESFLRGFFAHADVQEFVCLTHFASDEARFCDVAARQGVTRPIRGVRLDQMRGIAPLQVISFPSPNFATECWRRAPFGGAAHAICGITHTTATKAVMQGLFDLRAAPQMPWDAVICTSQAVAASLAAQMDLTDAYLGDRFGRPPPPRPLMPVIPLGVTCDDFTPDPAAGAALRGQLGLAPGEIACAIVARLSAHEKFDPLPLYLALARAQRTLGRRFHLLLCGQFRDDPSRRAFTRGAAEMMPEVGFHLLDGASATARKATLSAADLFLFPIDNVQETFGLAPIEAMAAGLPLIVSDWDGMKDTVPPEVGIRVPTEMPATELTAYLGQRHFGGTDSYAQYAGQLSALTRIDLAALTRALVALGGDADLRARMAAAGRARARSLYDWAAVMPQIQALWAEQAARLTLARAAGSAPPPMPATRLPPAPAPGVFFASYPSRTGPDPGRRYRAAPRDDRPDLSQTLDLRDYEATRRLIEARPHIAALLAALDGAGPAGARLEDLGRTAGLPQRAAARVLIWLMKYGFAQEADSDP
ncbi:glycosyltransferase family 4 protein [Rhodobacter sp. Har01]|uniref:glycosyltransferase family 4 protein n=1 Tax=Rhodobacter sp. Har01 TaxID=2883999 RepID=UPI001D063A0A|nr:glycosyltransferase family 4 protein [Rhodobacter sp. Har01]MCB6177598.1 glycosyltransferase family 4 protein [Rhodobacter sp. Har01]